VATDDFVAWLDRADIPASRRTPELDALLQAVFRFHQSQGFDYYSTRLLSHFLLNCETGLKVAQIARLLGISRPNASKQQTLSSKEAIKQAHHRMAGRPYGKLLPRYAGPIAAYLLSHPDCTRAELLDFINRTFGVQVSRIALYKFLKKYGLQDATASAQPASQASAAVVRATLSPLRLPSTPAGVVAAAAETAPPPLSLPAPAVAPLTLPGPATATMPLALPAPLSEQAPLVVPATPAAPPFCSDGRNTPAPSCCLVMPSTGSTRHATA
jgi:hypothetical protein